MRRQFSKWARGDRQSRPRFVDYSWRDLREHLERLFLPGMTWANCGEWHIDHVMPKCNFDPSIPEEISACWALANLRPLWAADNIRRPRDGSDLIAA
jgi:hypothetical protein